MSILRESTPVFVEFTRNGEAFAARFDLIVAYERRGVQSYLQLDWQWEPSMSVDQSVEEIKARLNEAYERAKESYNHG